MFTYENCQYLKRLSVLSSIVDLHLRFNFVIAHSKWSRIFFEVSSSVFFKKSLLNRKCFKILHYFQELSKVRYWQYSQKKTFFTMTRLLSHNRIGTWNMKYPLLPSKVRAFNGQCFFVLFLNCLIIERFIPFW